jgi:hypothetical protein
VAPFAVIMGLLAAEEGRDAMSHYYLATFHNPDRKASGR